MLATIRHIGKKNVYFSIEGQKEQKLPVFCLLPAIGGMHIKLFNGDLVFSPLHCMPLLPIPKKFYIDLPRGHGHANSITKKQAESSYVKNSPYLVVASKVADDASECEEYMHYIVRYAKNMYYVAYNASTDDAEIDAVRWAMQHGLPIHV